MTKTFEAFLKLDTRRYANQYVVMIGRRVVSSGKDLPALLKRVRRMYPLMFESSLVHPRKRYRCVIRADGVSCGRLSVKLPASRVQRVGLISVFSLENRIEKIACSKRSEKCVVEV